MKKPGNRQQRLPSPGQRTRWEVELFQRPRTNRVQTSLFRLLCNQRGSGHAIIRTVLPWGFGSMVFETPGGAREPRMGL